MMENTDQTNNSPQDTNMPSENVETIAPSNNVPETPAVEETPAPKGGSKKWALVVAVIVLLLGTAATAVVLVMNQQLANKQGELTSAVNESVDELDELISEIDESSYSNDTLDEITNEFLDDDLKELDLLDVPTVGEQL